LSARAPVRWSEALLRPGLLPPAVVFAVLFGFAVSIDYPATARGFKGDEATYYSLTHSIARDLDFTFQRQDLVRVWEEFPGPEGIFLKRGSKVEFRRSDRFPYVRMAQTEDPARYRLYYAKAYIYPLFAAPFVRLFGTSGFLIFHAVLLALSFAAAHRFLHAIGTSPALAWGFAAVFIFATVVPVYFIWLMPEIFNFATVFCACFLWAYKLAAPPVEAPGRFERFLRSGGSDVAAAMLLGVATFSKPTHILLIGPVLAHLLLRRDWRRFVVAGACFAAVVAGLFTFNAIISGDFNYQGGLRKTFYGRTGFPFANTWETFDNRGQGMTTDAVPFDILLHRDTATVLLWNVWYFVVGRYSGLLPYFCPAIVATGLFLAARGRRQPYQWLAAGTAAAWALALLAYMPYTYSGGGAPLGNRYYISYYPLFLFLVPPIASIRPVLAALAIGVLFTAKLSFNPFHASTNPGHHAKAGPLRLLPIERTLLNDLAVSAEPERSRRPLGGEPPVAGYFVDDGAYPPEGPLFWVRGGSRADLLLRAPAVDGPAGPIPLRVRSWTIEVTNGGTANRIAIGSGWLRPGAGRGARGGDRRRGRRAVQAGAVPHQLRLLAQRRGRSRLRAVPRGFGQQRQPLSRRAGPNNADLLQLLTPNS
jgi:hypothetical protein